VSTVCVGEYLRLEEIGGGIWNVYFGHLELGRLNERHMRIEDRSALGWRRLELSWLCRVWCDTRARITRRAAAGNIPRADRGLDV
jgi:hypothetical protein